ncbi:hypothetical protein MMC12_005269 [Toensbergia leucococca]|nr:hypothetical protein [Toensbergia leucococca]
MFRWINGPGAVFKDPLPGSTNYINAYDRNGRLIRRTETSSSRNGDETIKDLIDGEEDEGSRTEKNLASGEPIPKEMDVDLMPFPLNRQFRSQPVLSDALRDEIYERVNTQGKSVRIVSAELGIEMSRVGAVVRLKSVENEWIKKNKHLATTYARAILAMLPKTPFTPNLPPTTHESINDLPVHRDTLPQIFHPVAESRHFTRVDAGKVFSRNLLPADDRIPHPELIQLERERMAGVPREERIARQRERMMAELREKDEREQAKKEKEERDVRVVRPPQGRWDFKFRDISVESVGKDGRDKRGVGARYGFPHEDRKRGQIKIPTRVE